MNYKGYTIEEETDAWPLYFGLKYRYFLMDGGEVIHGATSKQDAIDRIDEEGINNSAPEPDYNAPSIHEQQERQAKIQREVK